MIIDIVPAIEAVYGQLVARRYVMGRRLVRFRGLGKRPNT